MTSGLELATALHAQEAEYPPGSTFGPRTLPTYELVWLLRGAAEVTIWTPAGTRESVHVVPGQALLVRAGERDHYRWDESGPASQHAYLHFDLVRACGLPPPPQWPRLRSFAELPVLEALCEYLLVLAREPGAAARRRSVQVLELVVETFVDGPVPDATRAALPEPLVRALDHVRRTWAEHGMTLLRAADVAAAAHVSVGYLHRLFQTHCGIGMADFLERVRLSRAARTLQRTDAAVYEVSSLCGYRDPFHFSRRFHRLYQVRPSEFRRLGLDADAPLRAVGLVELAAGCAAPDRFVRRSIEPRHDAEA